MFYSYFWARTGDIWTALSRNQDRQFYFLSPVTSWRSRIVSVISPSAENLIDFLPWRNWKLSPNLSKLSHPNQFTNDISSQNANAGSVFCACKFYVQSCILNSHICVTTVCQSKSTRCPQHMKKSCELCGKLFRMEYWGIGMGNTTSGGSRHSDHHWVHCTPSCFHYGASRDAWSRR
jgi:hypothetical protein